MNPTLFLRVASVALFFITIGHSTTFLAPRLRGPDEAALFEAMKNYKFMIMGVERSHFDFYQGGSMIMSVHLAMMVVLLWNLSRRTFAQQQGRRWLIMWLTAGTSAFAILCWTHFFAVPALSATVAALSLMVTTYLVFQRPNLTDSVS